MSKADRQFEIERTLLKRKREIEENLSNQSSPFLSSGTTNMQNKFANDGSFFNQFKKTPEVPIKLEKDIKQDKSSGYGKSSYTNFTSGGFSCLDSKPSTTNEIKTEHPLANSQPAQSTGETQSQWFQDALKQAREKAKQLAGVSHSANINTPMATPSAETSNFSSYAGSPASSNVTPGLSQVNQTSFNMPNNVMSMMAQGQHMEAIQGIMLINLTRTNPAIIAYANKVFNSLDLTDAQWNQCEEQMKMNIVFQILQEKKKKNDVLEQAGKVKYEYDSDEDTEGGTWEHKRRKVEMKKTSNKSDSLTRNAEGKHHIGDFLPPEELAGFLEKYQALKDGRDPDISDYKENKLTEDNIGYKMLKSMGWTEGSGLGSEGKGITAPVNQSGSGEKMGLGAAIPHSLSADDNEFDAYRKRMMLAYRFRPNPLNNPRRSYY